MKKILLIFTLSLASIISAEDIASERLMLADGLYRRGFFSSAVPEYETVLQNEKNLSAADAERVKLHLAECYQNTKEFAKARTLFTALSDSKTQGIVATAQLKLAMLNLEENRAKDAVPLLKVLLDTQKKNTKLAQAAAYYLGDAYEKLNQPDAAIFSFRIVVDSKNEYSLYAKMKLAYLLSQKTGKTEAVKEATALYRDVARQTEQPEIAAEAYAANAELFLRLNNFEESAKEYLILLAKNKEYLVKKNLILAAAWACYKAARYEDAKTFIALERMTRKSPKNDELLYLEASIARQLKSNDALTFYNKIIAEYPKSSFAPYARYDSLCMLYASGEYEKFISQVSSVIDLVLPKDVESLLQLQIEAAVKIEDFDNAAKAAMRLCEAFPKSQWAPSAAYRLAWFQQQKSQWRPAAEAYRAVAARYIDDSVAPDALYAAAYCYSRAKNQSDLMQTLNDLLVRFPQATCIPDALMLKIHAEIEHSDYNAASTTLDEMILRFPDSSLAAEALFLRGVLFFNNKNYLAADRMLERAIKKGLPYERDIEAKIKRAQALHQQGKTDEAANVLQPLIGQKDAVKLPILYLRWLTEFQIEQKKFKDAEQAARQMLTVAEKEIDKILAYLYLGKSLHELGQNASAIEALTNVLETKDPSTSTYVADAALQLAKIREASGDASTANEFFTLAVNKASASTPEARSIRAQAYRNLAKLAENAGNRREALRLNMMITILFDDPKIVPEAMERAIDILNKLPSRSSERDALIRELQMRYPNSSEARARRLHE